jgi:AraC family transcriptional regulator, regulatory protein of adaptative response / methylated-DNA-[protein]-cysteine methyltransferase
LSQEVNDMLAPTTNQKQSATFDDERWQAVQRRDRGRDGDFVYAVGTTGVYCRPSCPSRRPRRENVRFFGDPIAAERAGFRACRRCQPRSTMTRQEELVARAAAWIDAHAEERVTLSQLATALDISPGYLQRTFTRLTSVSPRAYAAARRLDAVKTRLRNGSDVTSALMPPATARAAASTTRRAMRSA